MNDRVQQRLADIDEAITAITSHLARGDLSDGLIFDAVRIRFLEIGGGLPRQAEEISLAGVLCSSPAFLARQQAVWIDLTLESIEKGASSRRSVSLRVDHLGVKAVRRDARLQRALLWGHGSRPFG